MTDAPITDEPSSDAPERASWREWWGLVILTLPMLALATDLTVLFLAMPSIAADLAPGTSQMLWILHIYGFLIGGFLITMGRLGDRVGRRRLLLIGAGAFAVLAVAAAYSTSAEMLIVVRALLGIAGATLMPAAYSLLRNMFRDPGQLRFAIAVMLGAFAGGTALGPMIGGILLQYFWWGSVFLANVPPLALLLVVGVRLLPEYRESRPHRLDLPSVGLSVGAVLAVIFGVQEAAEHGFHPAYPASIGLGVLLGAVFVRRQRRLADPLLDLALFRYRRLSASLVTVLLMGIGMVGGFYLFTQYLQWVAGFSPLAAGLATAPVSAAVLAGAMLAPLLTRWFRTSYLIGAGTALAALALLVGAVVGGSGTVVPVLICLAVAGFGQGGAMALAMDLIVSTAPLARAGSAASLQEVAGEVGSATGIAIGGGLGMLVYRAVVSRDAPAATPDEAVAVARDSVAGAWEAAATLPLTVGAELVAVAEDGLVRGLQTGFGFGAVMLTGAAILAVALLRSSDGDDRDDGDDDRETQAVASDNRV